MEQGELEGIAAAALVETGQDPAEPPNITRAIRTLLGPGGLRRGPALVRGDRACLVRVNEEWRIYASKHATLFDVCHELGHFLLRRVGYLGDSEEESANYLGAALLMPQAAMRAATGIPLHELAAAFRTSETCAALREAEVRRLPRAIVAPRHIHVRGPEAWIWPAEATIRQWLHRPRSGLKKTRMRDAPDRVVLDAEDFDAI